MGKGYTICSILLLQAFFIAVYAQDPVINEKRDSIPQEPRVLRITDRPVTTDTVGWVKDDRKLAKNDTIFIKEDFKPDPKKAVIYSAIFPGLGQIYNRKYWKLPIIYGGAVGLTYAIMWNGSKYSDYSQAYKDLMTGEGDSWKDFIGYGVNPDDILNDPSRLEWYRSKFKRNKDMFRQNRDLAIIVSVGVYVLCMIDAYVDAQLYDFDISPDISMRIEPMIMIPTQFSKASIGLRCNVNF